MVDSGLVLFKFLDFGLACLSFLILVWVLLVAVLWCCLGWFSCVGVWWFSFVWLWLGLLCVLFGCLCVIVIWWVFNSVGYVIIFDAV